MHTHSCNRYFNHCFLTSFFICGVLVVETEPQDAHQMPSIDDRSGGPSWRPRCPNKNIPTKDSFWSMSCGLTRHDGSDFAPRSHRRSFGTCLGAPRGLPGLAGGRDLDEGQWIAAMRCNQWRERSLHTHTYVHTCRHADMYTCRHTYTCMHMYVYTPTRIHVHRLYAPTHRLRIRVSAYSDACRPAIRVKDLGVK